MGTHARRLEKEGAREGTVLRLEALPESAPASAPFPAAKAVLHGVPGPKVRREVAPRRARAGQGQDGFQEPPSAEHRGTAGAGFQRGEAGGDLRPGLVRQQQTDGQQVPSDTKVEKSKG